MIQYLLRTKFTYGSWVFGFGFSHTTLSMQVFKAVFQIDNLGVVCQISEPELRKTHHST